MVISLPHLSTGPCKTTWVPFLHFWETVVSLSSHTDERVITGSRALFIDNFPNQSSSVHAPGEWLSQGVNTESKSHSAICLRPSITTSYHSSCTGQTQHAWRGWRKKPFLLVSANKVSGWGWPCMSMCRSLTDSLNSSTLKLLKLCCLFLLLQSCQSTSGYDKKYRSARQNPVLFDYTASSCDL